MNAETTRLLSEVQAATTLKSPHTHYGHGVWIDRSEDAVRKYLVEGSDPGVAMRSTLHPEEDIILTVMGNTGCALWPLSKEIERILGL